MTTKEIKEKALAKAAELLDNPGHWNSAAGALSASQAVSNLAYLGFSESEPVAAPASLAKEEKAGAAPPKEKEEKPAK